MSRQPVNQPALAVAFQSAHEVVVTKPAGMATELTSDPKGVSLIWRVRRELAAPAARLPHRLDRVTRGLVVVALSDAAIAHHNQQLREGGWDKLYVARIAVAGQREELLGAHKAHLQRVVERGRARAKVVRAGGQPALLEVLAVEAAPGMTEQAHVLIRLDTGRFHQIRAMLAQLGRPLVGDDLYGGRPGRLYLEHILLRFTPTGASEPVTIYQADDPARERLAESLQARLMQIKAMHTSS